MNFGEDPYEGVLLSGAMGGSRMPPPVMTNIEPINTFGLGMLQRRYPDEPDQNSTEAILANIVGNVEGGYGARGAQQPAAQPTQMPAAQGGYGRVNVPASQSYIYDSGYTATSPGATYTGFSSAPPATGPTAY